MYLFVYTRISNKLVLSYYSKLPIYVNIQYMCYYCLYINIQYICYYCLYIVWHIANSQIHSLFFDIDDIGLYNFDIIIESIEYILGKLYTKEQLGQKIVMKNQGQNKYHVYFPLIYVNCNQRQKLNEKINKYLKYEIIDIQCAALRLEGFLKWDKDNPKRFVTNTNYINTRWLEII